MYTFIFLSTPVLSPNDEEIPHGFSFATFILSSMLGSSRASRLLARATIKVESCMQVVFAVSAFTFLLPIITSYLVAPSKARGGGITSAGCVQALDFCTFESCVEIFWPSIMKMRSQYIPEEARSTITSDKIATLVKAANVEVEAYWPGLFAKLVEKRIIEDLITNIVSGGGELCK